MARSANSLGCCGARWPLGMIKVPCRGGREGMNISPADSFHWCPAGALQRLALLSTRPEPRHTPPPHDTQHPATIIHLSPSSTATRGCAFLTGPGPAGSKVVSHSQHMFRARGIPRQQLCLHHD
ncbi:hypothetical protein DPEC_G00138360 [Dallia pectoralis]|uniref:Uncharacterized protein n=1 Tax=Dallia pectoralis TaxID=75939 RepID=A0ACC2GLL6_DALPE|nr:hypothetical protein DPEC_G00138360 [Dallia pectoralis]